MEKQYIIRRLPAGTGALNLSGQEFFPEEIPVPWSNLDEAAMDAFPWDENGYKPAARAKIGWNETGIHVLLYANEPEILTTAESFGDCVCVDSCMEFFLQPAPDNDPRYLNTECSAKPVLLMQNGTGRHDRVQLTAEPEGMELSGSVHKGAWWAVSYTIPAAYLKTEYGVDLVSGRTMRANLYICGDNTRFPHYGIWSPAPLSAVPRPDYHRPEWFSPMVLE